MPIPLDAGQLFCREILSIPAVNAIAPDLVIKNVRLIRRAKLAQRVREAALPGLEILASGAVAAELNTPHVRGGYSRHQSWEPRKERDAE